MHRTELGEIQVLEAQAAVHRHAASDLRQIRLAGIDHGACRECGLRKKGGEYGESDRDNRK